ncbi:hypothetical protein VSDG_08703 [Cytospora chrysosperma]|uniref:Uncharacterized protein n=1 Tax=Cytospora chrysosperma TaxID=252740 RepID=A0A423VDE4_CYTCH|nr:hypothetical protein VSDG_08703 [Valsa sordida]
MLSQPPVAAVVAVVTYLVNIDDTGSDDHEQSIATPFGFQHRITITITITTATANTTSTASSAINNTITTITTTTTTTTALLALSHR